MKDVFFNDFDKKRKNQNIDSKYDTSDIPLTKSERDFQDRINQQKYEHIIEAQNRNNGDDTDYNYDDVSSYSDKQTSRRAKSVPESSDSENIYSNKRPNNETPDGQEKPKKKKKRGCGCGTMIICFILIVALLGAGSIGYLYSLCGKTNYVKSKDNAYISSSQLKSSNDVKNILLLGTDQDSEDTSRSDTMMLVSIDKKNKEIKFTSFMRDMWVTIPGNGESKMNAAYAYGGAQLVMDTIEYNFKIDIDNYVMVDFEMFKKLIDGLGGVTVDITESEANFINKTTHATVKTGTNTLDGDYALIYCRIRKLDSDFMRTQRQRKVMAAIMDKIKTQNVFKTFSAMTQVLPLVTTDMSAMELTTFALSSVSLLKYSNDQMRIPVDGMYTSKRIKGQDAIVPDLNDNVKALQQFIYG
jgi:LCP family protein required for cell wall assembly